MKDFTITAKRIKTEALALLICFLLANVANLYSIIAYNTSFLELFTSLGFVVATAAILYIIWCAVRLIACGTRYLFAKKNR